MTPEPGNKFTLSNTSLARLEGVHADLVSTVKRAIEITAVDFAVVQGARTQDQQDELYAQGRTTPGKIVTQTRNSRHIGGFAVDLAAFVDGAVSWNGVYYPFIATAMKKAAGELNVPIVWGGDWVKFKDLPHFELPRAAYPA